MTSKASEVQDEDGGASPEDGIPGPWTKETSVSSKMFPVSPRISSDLLDRILTQSAHWDRSTSYPFEYLQIYSDISRYHIISYHIQHIISHISYCFSRPPKSSLDLLIPAISLDANAMVS